MAYRAYKRNKRGSIILRNGQRITLREQKALKSAVSSANRKRKRLLEKLPKRAKQKYNMFGKESDFVNRKRDVDFSKYRSKKEFVHYLEMSQKIASGNFQKRRAEIYKENYKKALRNVFGQDAEMLVAMVDELSLNDFREMVENDELEEIGYLYFDPHKQKYNRIGKQLRANAS